MDRQTLSLLLSFITLFICLYIYFFFNKYTHSPLFQLSNELLLNNNTKICNDTLNKTKCHTILTNNNMISFNNQLSSLFIDKNLLLCNDISNINSCICLHPKCNYFKQLLSSNSEPIQSIQFISSKITFSKSDGMFFGSSILPLPLSVFTLSFSINISKMNETFDRILFKYNNFTISIKSYTSLTAPCNSKLSLSIMKKECIETPKYNEFIHYIFIFNKNTIQYYINGISTGIVPITSTLEKSDDYINIGNNCPGITIANMYFFNNIINNNIVSYLFNEHNYIIS